MYCKHCGSEMPDDAIFCSHCGTRLVEAAPAEPAAKPAQPVPKPAPAKPAPAPQAKSAEEAPRKPFLEGMQWNVSEYPDSNVIEKTEDINFDWNTDPSKVEDFVPHSQRVRAQAPKPQESGPKKSAEGIRVSEIFDRVVPAQEAREAVAQTGATTESRPVEHRKAAAVRPPEHRTPAGAPEHASAAEGAEEAVGLDLGKFQTFNRKNDEFRQLLDREYEKIKDEGAIGREQSQADAIASERFDSRQENMTMDQFLEKEGAVKLYEPKPLESDVLARIEAQEKQRARQKAEEEARAKALAEARAAEEAKKKAEMARLNSEAEASAAAAEEIRLAEEEEIRRRTEAEAKRKAEAQAARLEAIAARQAAMEQAALLSEEQRAAEEARAKAEAEARARAEAEARARAEAEAARKAEEAARQKAETELNAAREAARIRAQQEANMAAREEARFRQEQERRREAEALMQRQAQQAQQAGPQKVEDEVRDALAQTARMREEEEAKIKAALAGIRTGRFTNIIQPSEKAAEHAPEAPAAPPAAEAPAVAEILGGAAAEAAPAPAAPATIAEESAPIIEPALFEEPAPAEPVIPIPAEGFTPAAEPVVTAPEVPVAAPEVPAAAAAAAPLSTAPEAIEKAHEATRSQIDEMARARENFFADFPDANEIAEKAETATRDFSQTRLVDKDELMADIDSTKKISRDAFHTDITGDLYDVPPEPAIPDTAQAHAANIEEKVDEIDDLLSQFVSVEEPKAPAQVSALPEDYLAENAPAQPAAQRSDESMFTGFVMDAPLSDYMEPAELEAIKAREAQAAQAAQAPAPAPEIPAAPVSEAAPAFAAEEPQAAPEEDIPAGEKPGLEDTMVMPIARSEIEDALPDNADAVFPAAQEPKLTKKEKKMLEKQKAKEAQWAAMAAAQDDYDDEYYEESKKGGIGRTILMIILIILCLIFALELAGIGIKLLAPTSGAAQFIDNILNNLIHMITGSSAGTGGQA